MMRYLSMNAKYSALSERDQTYVIYANRHMENAEAAEGRKNPYTEYPAYQLGKLNQSGLGGKKQINTEIKLYRKAEKSSSE